MRPSTGRQVWLKILQSLLDFAHSAEVLRSAVRRNAKVRKYNEQDSEGRACTKKRRGIFQAESYSVQAGQSSVQGLPADVLLQIYAFLTPKDQRETLHLVCRQWQEVLQGPVALWRHLELDFPAAMDLGLDGARLTPSRRFQVGAIVLSVSCLATSAFRTWLSSMLL